MVTFPLDLNLLDYDKTMEHRTTLQKNGIEVLKMALFEDFGWFKSIYPKY